MPIEYVPRSKRPGATAVKTDAPAETPLQKSFRIYRTPIVDTLGQGEAVDKLAQPGLADSPELGAEDSTAVKIAKAAIQSLVGVSPNKAQLKGFISGSSKAVTPETVARAASLANPASWPALAANTVVGVQGVKDVFDPEKTLGEKGFAALDALGSAAGVGAGWLKRGADTAKKAADTAAKKAEMLKVSDRPRKTFTVPKSPGSKEGSVSGSTAHIGASVEKPIADAIDKAVDAKDRLKDLDKAIKTQRTAAKEKRVLNRQVRARELAAEQAADAQRAKQLEQETENARKLAEIEAAKEGLEPTGPSINESMSATTPSGKRLSKSRRFVEPADDVDGDGGGSRPAPKFSVDGPPKREVVEQALYKSKKKAKEDALALYKAGEDTDVVMTPTGYKVVFKNPKPGPDAPVATPDAQAAPVTAAEPSGKFEVSMNVDGSVDIYDAAGKVIKTGSIDEVDDFIKTNDPDGYSFTKVRQKQVQLEGPSEPPAPPVDPTPAPKPTRGPKGPKPAPEPAAVTPEQRQQVTDKRYNKAEAAAIAKATGGVAHQDGPRQWSVQYPEAVVEPITPTPTLPPAKDAPGRSSVDLLKDGDAKLAANPVSKAPGSFDESRLTLEERRRIHEVQPSRNWPRTPEEQAEYMWLHAKGRGESPDPVPAAPAEDPVRLMQEMAQTANKPAAPVGRVKFPTGKMPGKTQTPDPVQTSLIDPVPSGKAGKLADTKSGSRGLEELLDATHGPDADLKINPQGHGTLDDNVTKLKALTPATPPDALSKAKAKLLSKAPDAPVDAPVVPGGAIPARLFKSRPEADKAGYGAIKDAKAAGEKVPEAGRSIAGQNAQAASRAAKAKAVDAPKPVTPDPTLGPTSDDLSKLSPEDQLNEITRLVQSFKNRPKGGSTLSAFGGGQLEDMAKIAAENPAFTRAMTTIAGAGTGAAANDEDPVTGAVVGGAIGFGGPTLFNAVNKARTAGAPATPELAKKFGDMLDTVFKMMPDFQRASLLSKPLPLIMNSVVGPWGSIIMHGLEDAIQLDPRGIKLLKLALGPKFLKNFKHTMPRAKELIGEAADRSEMMSRDTGPEWYKRLTQYPGVFMTAGDESARELAKLAGYTDEEARVMTLTSEPFTSVGAGISKMKKGAVNRDTGKRGWLIDMTLPFYRTNMNQIEQGLERFPFVGIWMNMRAKPVPAPWKQQFVQQVMGLNAGGVGYMMGEETPPEDAKYVLKFINNFGGQYGALAAAGFMMGQASQRGASDWKALTSEITGAMPLPSTQPIADAMQNVGALIGVDGAEPKWPAGFTPGILDPEDPLTGLLVGAVTGSGASTTPQTGAQPGTGIRYIPRRQRTTDAN